jgi:hypothetical protein
MEEHLRRGATEEKRGHRAAEEQQTWKDAAIENLEKAQLLVPCPWSFLRASKLVNRHQTFS